MIDPKSEMPQMDTFKEKKEELPLPEKTIEKTLDSSEGSQRESEKPLESNLQKSDSELVAKEELDKGSTFASSDKEESIMEPTSVLSEKEELYKDSTSMYGEKGESVKEPTLDSTEKEDQDSTSVLSENGDSTNEPTLSTEKDQLDNKHPLVPPDKDESAGDSIAVPKKQLERIETVPEGHAESLYLNNSEGKIDSKNEEMSETASPSKTEVLNVESERKQVPEEKVIPNVQNMEMGKESEDDSERKVTPDSVPDSDVKPDTLSDKKLTDGEDADIKPDTASNVKLSEGEDSGPTNTKHDPAQNEEVLIGGNENESESLYADNAEEPSAESQDRSAPQIAPTNDQPEAKSELPSPNIQNAESEGQISSSTETVVNQGNRKEVVEDTAKLPTEESREKLTGLEERQEKDAVLDQKMPTDGGLSGLLHSNDVGAESFETHNLVASPTLSSEKVSTGTETLNPSQNEDLPEKTEGTSNIIVGAETIVEAGTTLVLDSSGNVMTIIPPSETYTPSTVATNSQTDDPVSLSGSKVSQTEQVTMTPQRQPSTNTEIKPSEQAKEDTKSVLLQTSISEIDMKKVSAEKTTEDFPATPHLDASQNQAETVAKVSEQVSQSSLIMPTATDSAHAVSISAADTPSASSILLHSSVVEAALPSSYNSNNTANLDTIGPADSSVPDNLNLEKDLNPSQETYESVDFNSRKVLSVSSSQQIPKPQQNVEGTAEQLSTTEPDAIEKKKDEGSAHIEPPKIDDDLAASSTLPTGYSDELQSAVQDENKEAVVTV